MTNCKYIDNYITMVRSADPYPYCKWQHKLCDFVEKVFETENVYVDEEQLEKYLALQKYFDYRLLPWELFVFTLHICTYTEQGYLRFPYCFVNVGRGAGKNGLLSFIDFCLLTPIHGVKNYDIYIYAMSEDQAKTSWTDIYDILDDNKATMKKYFYWTKEIITNKATNSSMYYCTSSAKSKDGQRPGKVDFDELHAYLDMKLIDVAQTGLGKKKNSRKTIVSTNGLVRGGPFDSKLETAMEVLNGEEDDNGELFFICCIDGEEEIDIEEAWFKANPSLYPEMSTYYDMLREIRLEYKEYKKNPAEHVSFPAKRMNCPPKILENEVTPWENVLATNQPIREDLIYGMPCCVGIDYMKTTDFLSAGLLYRVMVDGEIKDYWIQKTWICRQSHDLNKIKAPLTSWAIKGDVEFVESSEIPPELPAVWVANEAAKRGSTILCIGIDDYRYALLKKALLDINFSADEGWKNVIKIRPSDEMKRIPLITSGFIQKKFCFGDVPVMRWAIQNSKTVVSNSGNITYGKIEPKSRKTDPFKAFVAAEIISDCLDDYVSGGNLDMPDVIDF